MRFCYADDDPVFFCRFQWFILPFRLSYGERRRSGLNPLQNTDSVGLKDADISTSANVCSFTAVLQVQKIAI